MLTKEEKRSLRKASGLTRFCPHCGKELLWERDFVGMYVAMDYDSDPRVPHVLSCTGRKEQK